MKWATTIGWRTVDQGFIASWSHHSVYGGPGLRGCLREGCMVDLAHVTMDKALGSMLVL